jgi:hypothetical protein
MIRVRLLPLPLLVVACTPPDDLKTAKHGRSGCIHQDDLLGSPVGPLWLAECRPRPVYCSRPGYPPCEPADAGASDGQAAAPLDGACGGPGHCSGPRDGDAAATSPAAGQSLHLSQLVDVDPPRARVSAAPAAGRRCLAAVGLVLAPSPLYLSVAIVSVTLTATP